jgi:DnaJ-class molecular chaperone
MRTTCPDCGGRGESWTGLCERCAGTGTELQRRQLRVSVPAGVVHGSRFCFTVVPRHNLPTRIELQVLVA